MLNVIIKTVEQPVEVCADVKLAFEHTSGTLLSLFFSPRNFKKISLGCHDLIQSTLSKKTKKTINMTGGLPLCAELRCLQVYPHTCTNVIYLK